MSWQINKAGKSTSLPPEIVEIIIAAVAELGRHKLHPCTIDPPTDPFRSTHALARLVRLSRHVAEAAKPLLWERIEISTPRRLHAFLRTLTQNASERGPRSWIRCIDLSNYRPTADEDDPVADEETMIPRFVPRLPHLRAFAASSYFIDARTKRLGEAVAVWLLGFEADHTVNIDAVSSLVAIDLTRCDGFLAKYVLINNLSANGENGQGLLGRSAAPGGLSRVSLHGCIGLPPIIVEAILRNASHSLTHLDLFSTRVDVDCLRMLNKTLDYGSLIALNLGSCPNINDEELGDIFFEGAQGFALLEQLNLSTEPSVLRSLEPRRPWISIFLLTSPLVKSGRLTYLDISGSNVSDDDLAIIHDLPNLRSLGLNYCPRISLRCLATALPHHIPNLEVLTLVGSCTAMAAGGSAYSDGTDTEDIAPANMSAKLAAAMGLLHLETLHSGTTRSRMTGMALHRQLLNRLELIHPAEPDLSCSDLPDARRSKLRVVELSLPLLKTLEEQPPSEEWTVVHGRGKRSWYVDQTRMWETAICGMGMSREKEPANEAAGPQTGDPDASHEHRGRTRRLPSARNLNKSEIVRSRSGGRSISISPPRDRPRSLSPFAARPGTSAPSHGQGSRDDHHPSHTLTPTLAPAAASPPSELGWHAKKLEVLDGLGFFGRDRPGVLGFAQFG